VISVEEAYPSEEQAYAPAIRKLILLVQYLEALFFVLLVVEELYIQLDIYSWAVFSSTYAITSLMSVFKEAFEREELFLRIDNVQGLCTVV